MIINVAGAGAGKTTGLAKEIIEKHEQNSSNKKIFCVAFTNNAVKSIKDKLLSHYDVIPENIIVCTIHSFLFQEFVSPYYYVIYNKHYASISTIELPDKPEFKNYKLAELDRRNVLHIEAIPEKAKWVVVKKSTDKKLQKDYRSIVLGTFKSYCQTIFVDEAQDIDGHMKEIFEKLDSEGIEVVLKGDPKQDMRGYGYFRELINARPQSVIYDATCHRCPAKHLKITNSLIHKNERQTSEKTGGSIEVIFESSCDIDTLLSSQFDLKYIYQKNDLFETHSNVLERPSRFDTLYYEIYTILCEIEPDVQVREIRSYNYTKGMIDLYNQGKPEKQIINRLETHTGTLSKQQYAKVKDALLVKQTTTSKKHEVSSIESIKGLEGERCLFILTSELAPYLFLDKTAENKIKTALYVALTRSKEKLVILICKEVEKFYDQSSIKDFFTKIMTS